MSRQGKHTYETKLEAVKQYLAGKAGTKVLAKEIGTSYGRISEWVSSYRSMGEAGLRTERTNAQYPAEIKQKAVAEYLSGQNSQQGVCEKYKIRSTSQLRNWVKKYNGHEELKTTGTGGSIVTKGRSTTIDERIEIVKYCIEHQYNYNQATETYQVSYQQARAWTKKYEQYGIDGLYDRRGKRKPLDAMTDVEKLQAQLKLKDAELLRLQMENDLLKKLEALERGIDTD